MALIMMDGFDKYGGPNSNQSTQIAFAVSQLIATGDWNASAGGGHQLTAPLSSTGYALFMSNGTNIARNFTTNYPRLMGGIRISPSLGGNPTNIISFRDGGTIQCGIDFSATTGVLEFRNGSVAGTIIATGPSVLNNTTHHVGWDITFGNSAAYQIWLDGVSVISGTGDTTTTANNYANSVMLGGVSGNGIMTLDDFYLTDASGGSMNTPLTTMPRIETTFPVSDASVQFTVGGSIWNPHGFTHGGSQFIPGTNFLHLRRFVATVSGNLNTVYFNCATGGGNTRVVIYGETAGVAGSLLAQSNSTVNNFAGSNTVIPLITPFAMVAGTPYWIGTMNDANIQYYAADSGFNSVRAAVTYASGAPSTAPAMTAGQANMNMWGTLTGVTPNWYEVSQQPSPGNAPFPGIATYVYGAAAGNEDLYGFGPLSGTPGIIYSVGVKGLCQKMDVGARTVSLKTRSGIIETGGSNPGFTPNFGSYQWVTSFFDADPAGGLWTGPSLNAALGGFSIDT